MHHPSLETLFAPDPAKGLAKLFVTLPGLWRLRLGDLEGAANVLYYLQHDASLIDCLAFLDYHLTDVLTEVDYLWHTMRTA